MEQSQLVTRAQGSRRRAVAAEEAREMPAIPAGGPGGEDRPLVLVADDDPDVLDLVVERMESMGFEMVAASDDGEALRLPVERRAIPILDGLEVTRRLRFHDPVDGVAVTLVTARVADIGQPFRLRELTEAVTRKQEQRALRRREAATRRMVDERAGRERERALAGIRSLAAIVDGKSPATRGHSARVAALAQLLAIACGWSHERAALLREVALVHDVGKIGVPDAILLKPGPLDEDERRQIRGHPVVGAQMVAGVLSDEQVSWLRHHHERFAGGGYPDGLRGVRIPLGARLLAIADAWDAMTSDRAYQAARTPEEALEECRREAGGHFCPKGIAALGLLWDEGRLTVTGAAGAVG